MTLINPIPVAADRATLLARLPDLAKQIAVGAAERDLKRELPFEAFRLVRASGITALRIPERLGGPGGSVEDVIEAIAVISTGDSNVGHALRSHFNYVETQILTPDEDRAPEAIPRILQGRLFAGAHTELGTAKPGDITVRLTRDGENYRLNGRKWYATGTAFADYASFSALDEEGQPTGAMIPVDREGLSILDDWDGMGQKLTASGGVLLDNVLVYPHELGRKVNDGLIGRHTSTLRQLHLAACAGGAIRAALIEGIDYVRNHARATHHSAAATAREDHFVQKVVGEIAARSLAIDALLRESARTLDRSATALLAGDPDAIEAALIESALTTSRTQLVLAELGLKAAEQIFELGGGTATSTRFNFDRHWRNIRTVLNHNPLLHKARVVGDYYINGTTTHLLEGRVF